ncbi:MAG: FHA domain-containing protein [Deltaproteobacteria bacterium]|nr:FHA domain-containing protein [Deltaproteobacteria bacterium]
MRAYARILAPDDTEWLLGAGDLIGRLATAALTIDDARVSEAHAMISLRGGELHLLGLRGLFVIDGPPVQEVALREGMEIQLAPGVALEVLEIELPSSVLALQSDDLPRQVLTGASSLLLQPRLALVGRYRDDAAAHLWSSGEGWRIRVRGEPARDLRPGDRITLGETVVEAVEVALERAGPQRTRVDGALSPPLQIIAHYDTVHIHKEAKTGQQGEPLVLDGIAARIVSELVAVGGPAAWEVLAGEIWKNEGDRVQLRRKWDVSLARLRRKLRQAGVRPDLIRAGGTGQVELLLYPADSVDDQT